MRKKMMGLERVQQYLNNGGTSVELPYDLTSTDFTDGSLDPNLAKALSNRSALIAETGGPAIYEGDPIVGLTDEQIEANRQKVEASDAQGALGKLGAYETAKGITGGRDFTPEDYVGADYLNPYQDKVINRATQGAVDATAGAFGNSGTIGSSRNATAASRAAFAASQPYLASAYDKQFEYDKAVRDANVNLHNKAGEGNLDRIERYLGRVGTAQGDLTAGADTLAEVGQSIFDRNQAIRNEEIKKFNAEQQRPFLASSELIADAQIAQAAKSGQPAPTHRSALDKVGDFLRNATKFLSVFNEGGMVPTQKVRRKY